MADKAKPAEKKPKSPKNVSTGEKRKETTTEAPVVKKKPRVGRPRNYKLQGGVYRFSRSRMYKKKAIWKFVNKKTSEKTVKPKKVKPKRVEKKPIGGERNGGHRLVYTKKMRNYYPTESKPRKRNNRKTNFARHKRNLRKSIQPGKVLIILAGKHRGKRVVFLKQLKTGLLLVTGPFKLNRCPLRRINQIFVIATKTQLDISKIKLPEHLDDEYFKRKRTRRPKKDEGEIFETKKETYRVSDDRKKDQIDVDKEILEVIRKRPDKRYMFGYLGSMFGLRNHMYPHKMRF